MLEVNAAAGAVPALVQLLISGYNKDISTAWILGSLVAFSSASQHAIAAAAGIRALVQLLGSNKQRRLHDAAHALYELQAGRPCAHARDSGLRRIGASACCIQCAI